MIEVLWTPNGGRLVVEVLLPDHGALIRCESAVDTFVEVIKRIGIEQVKNLEINVGSNPLISTTQFQNPPAQRQVGEYYITMGMDPASMARKLRQIADCLNITLYAELFERN